MVRTMQFQLNRRAYFGMDKSEWSLLGTEKQANRFQLHKDFMQLIIFKTALWLDEQY